MGISKSTPKSLRLLSYNIHKGFSGGIPQFTLKKMREEIRRLQPDLLFLQEVHGEHHGHRKKHADYPLGSQFEFLAEEIWPHFTYGKNSVYTEGHHGNAVLSKFPIIASENVDISQSRFERRGILHATIELPDSSLQVHALCAHLGLFGWDRKKQLESLALRIANHIPQNAPVVAAGDFNDWRKAANNPLSQTLHLKEAFLNLHGSHARTFPSRFPVLSLDRVYFRGFEAQEARRMDTATWSGLSDHLALWVELTLSG